MRYLFSFLLTTALLAPSSVTVGQSRQTQQAPQDDQSDRPKIDVESYSVDITIVPQERRLTGQADIKFKQLDRRHMRRLISIAGCGWIAPASGARKCGSVNSTSTPPSRSI